MGGQHPKKNVDFLLLKALVVVCNTGIFALCWQLYYTKRLYLTFSGNGNYMVIGMFLVLYTVFASLYGGFQLTTSRISELAYSHAIALVMTYFFMYIVTWLLVRSSIPNIGPIALALVVCAGLATLWSLASYRITNRLIPPRHTLIICDNDEAYKSGLAIIKKYNNRFQLIGTVAADIPVLEIENEIEKHAAEAVMLCGLTSSMRNDLTKYCIANSILAYVRPNIGDLLMGSAKMFHMNNLPVYLCQRANPSISYRIFKRATDLVISSVGLLLLSPLMLLTALAIKLYDGGPVLYTQKRMTKDRKVFLIHKFRSMKMDTGKDGGSIVTLQNDDRITPIGKWIRPCRIDEIPQLFDILLGNMTLVGPRPERLETIELYEREIPEFALRLQVKAGLTGYAQVYGKANTSPYDKLQMDLMYIGQQNIWMDLKIILNTFKILFVPESTEGFETERHDAMTATTDALQSGQGHAKIETAEADLIKGSFAQ